MTRRRYAPVAVALLSAFVLAACGGGEPSSSGGDPSGGTAAVDLPDCQAVEVGPITRCENFYEDFWPIINKKLDELYQQAKQTDGGRLVVWDWYELSPEVIAAFTDRFPGLKVETKGLTYNISSAIISAKATGARNSDVVSGSITSMTAMYDQGFWEKVDWTTYGVPREYLTIGAPELLPDSVNGPLLQYNTDKVDRAPTDLEDYVAPEWKGKLAVQSFNAQNFTGYGMKFGKDRMVKLIEDLKAAGSLVVTDKATQLVSNGDVPVTFAGQLFNPNPALEVVAPQPNAMYVQFNGVNVEADNKPAATLYALWQAFDPDWLRTKLTDPDFATSTLPFPGLPASVFEQTTGLMKKNQDAWFAVIEDGSGIFETQDNRDQYNDLIQAADKAMNG